MDERVESERRIRSLSAQAEYLRAEIEEEHGFDEIVGNSPALRTSLRAVAQVARTDATVLIQGARALLQTYGWPGNVRELRNVIERALITSSGGPLSLENMFPEGAAATAATAAAVASLAADGVPTTEILGEKRLRAIERANMIAALEASGWRVSGENGAAELIGISPSTFKSRMKAFGIVRSREPEVGKGG